MGAVADERELKWWQKKRQRGKGVQAKAWRNAGPEVNIFRSKPGSTTHHWRMKYGLNYHDSNQIWVEQPRRQYELSIHLPGVEENVFRLMGLHHENQKLLFCKKERDSKAFLDISGVKDLSKIVLGN